MFVYYTWVKPGTVAGSPTTRPVPNLPDTYHDRLERYTLDANGVAIPGSVKIFVDLTNQTVWHHGGGMFFIRRTVFFTGRTATIPSATTTRSSTKVLYSGVFRIDVDCRGGNISHAPPRQPTGGFTANYFIPNDNPFVGQSNVLEEFFCLGLRSPHRMTITIRRRGKIFIGDVGESSREEIDVINPGESGVEFPVEPLRGQPWQDDGAITSASAAGRCWIIRTPTAARSSAAMFIAARNSRATSAANTFSATT